MNQKSRWYQFENCTDYRIHKLGCLCRLPGTTTTIPHQPFYIWGIQTIWLWWVPVCHPMLWMHWKSRNSFGLSNAIFFKMKIKLKDSPFLTYWRWITEAEVQGDMTSTERSKNNSHAETRPEVHKTMTLNVRLVKFKSGVFFQHLSTTGGSVGEKKPNKNKTLTPSDTDTKTQPACYALTLLEKQNFKLSKPALPVGLYGLSSHYIMRGRPIMVDSRREWGCRYGGSLRNQIMSQGFMDPMTAVSGSLICTHQLQLGSWLWTPLSMCISKRATFLVFVYYVQYIYLCIAEHVYTRMSISVRKWLCVLCVELYEECGSNYSS